MRRPYILFIFLFVAAEIIISQSCNEADVKSRQGEARSHEFGTNCMSCHQANGNGKTAFTIAGSVLDEARAGIQKKCIIQLYTKPKAQGELVGTFYGDASGNFYSTEKIDFSAGLYPTLLGTPGVKEDTKHMPTPIFSGACNSCHGPTTEKLGID